MRFINIGANKFVVSAKYEDSEAWASYDNTNVKLNSEWYLIKVRNSVDSDTHLTSCAAYSNSGNYLASLTDNSGTTTKYTYDPTNGNFTKSTDGLGIDTKYTYDTVGKTTGVSFSSRATPRSVSYTYYGDQLSSITMAIQNKNTTSVTMNSEDKPTYMWAITTDSLQIRTIPSGIC